MEWNTQEAVKRIKDTFSFIKDVSNVARDVLLLLLFIFLIFFPQNLNAILARAGITQINGGFFSLKTQVEASANQSRVAAQDFLRLILSTCNMLRSFSFCSMLLLVHLQAQRVAVSKQQHSRYLLAPLSLLF